MNLWPFSKKSSDEFVLDSTMNLPPGVVLASPDDPESASLPLPSVPTPEHTPDEHAAAILEAPPELPKQNNEPPLSPEIQQILGLAPPPSAPQAPTSDLPDLPAELFGEAAPTWQATVSTPPAAEPSPALTFEPSSGAETPGIWTPSEPEPEPTPVAFAEPPAMEIPSLIPNPALSEDILSELFSNPSESLSPPPSMIEYQSLESTHSIQNITPPAESSSFNASPNDDLSWEALPDMESDQFYTPLETFDDSDRAPVLLNPSFQDLDDSASELMQPNLDDSEPSFTIGSMGEVAALMPPEPELTRQASDAAQSLQEASGALADLLANAETFQIDNSWEAAGEPDTYQSSFAADDSVASENSFDPEDPQVSIEIEPSPVQDSFFANATFNNMDGFGESSSDTSLFIEPTTTEIPIANNYASTENALPEHAMQSSSEPEATWATNDFNEFDKEASTIYNMGDETYRPEYDMPAGNQLAAAYDEFTHDSFDEGLEIGGDDITSYDLGHYDDPDEPAIAFVLDADHEPEQPSNLEQGTPKLNQDQAVEILKEISAQYYVGQSLPSEPAVAIEPEVIIPPPPPPAVIAQEPVRPQPSSQPMEQATQKPLPPEPIPQKSPPRRPTYRHDSITDALDSFEQEMLMRDSHFITDSINNLVDRYFAQKKAENEW